VNERAFDDGESVVRLCRYGSRERHAVLLAFLEHARRRTAAIHPQAASVLRRSQAPSQAGPCAMARGGRSPTSTDLHGHRQLCKRSPRDGIGDARREGPCQAVVVTVSGCDVPPHCSGGAHATAGPSPANASRTPRFGLSQGNGCSIA
jgi:hypothetical protein